MGAVVSCPAAIVNQASSPAVDNSYRLFVLQLLLMACISRPVFPPLQTPPRNAQEAAGAAYLWRKYVCPCGRFTRLTGRLRAIRELRRLLQQPGATCRVQRAAAAALPRSRAPYARNAGACLPGSRPAAFPGATIAAAASSPGRGAGRPARPGPRAWPARRLPPGRSLARSGSETAPAPSKWSGSGAHGRSPGSQTAVNQKGTRYSACR